MVGLWNAAVDVLRLRTKASCVLHVVVGMCGLLFLDQSNGRFRAFKDFQNKTDAPAVDSVVDAATMLSEKKQWIVPRGSAMK